MVEQVFRELPELQCNLQQSLGDDSFLLLCSILLKRGLDRLFNNEYWYEYTGTEKQILQIRTAILTAFAFMDNTLERDVLRHYAREILARILEPSDQLQQFSDEDIDEILRTYRCLYYPLNFFRSAVRELRNSNHWDLVFEEKKLYKSYEIKCLSYNRNGDEWYEKSSTPQIMHGTGPHAIIYINWKNYDFGK